MHIENGDVKDNIYEYIYMYSEFEEDGNIVFDAILSPKSRSLRRFTAYQLQTDVYMALCNFRAAGLARQLAISFECFACGDYYELAQLLREDRKKPFLPMQFRMMDLELWRDIYDAVSAQQILDGLLSTNLENLEGLMVHLLVNPAIDGEFDHLDELQGALLQMPNLTQLVIGETRRSKPTDEMLKCAAQKLANAVPQLRYINVCRKFWRICQGIDADSKETKRLEELEEREKEDVEFFGHTIFKYY